MSYESKLNNINQGADTTKKVLGVAAVANPKVLEGFAVLLLLLPVFILLVAFLYKKAVGNAVGNFWDFLTRPYKNLLAQIRISDKVGDTGTKLTIDLKTAKETADAIYMCFSKFSDDENRLYGILKGNTLNSQADWVAVCQEFGSRVNPKPLTVIGIKSDVDMEGLISSNLSNKELQKCREILNAKGIKPNF